jgi:predicted metal-dependent phosphoesterase TrpH
MIRVGVHLHSNYSADSNTSLIELVTTAQQLQLSRLALTDHNTAAGALELGRHEPGLAIVGEEVRTTEGEIIGLFISDTVAPDRTPEDVLDEIRAQGGVTYIPHPLDPYRAHFSRERMLELADRIDIVETYNQWCRPEFNRAASELAEEMRKPTACGSDAHEPEQLAHCWLEMPEFNSPRDFLDKLANARHMIAAAPVR